MSTQTQAKERPVIRYHGGKWKLAPWIIGQFPKHRIYVEPFGGAGSVLMRKKRSYAEIYNDLDDELVNLFKVVRDRGKELKDQLANTPFSRTEFKQSYERSDDPLEQARRTVLRSYMGFGSAIHRSTGFRANSNRSGTTPAHDWKNLPIALDWMVARLAGVVIENRPAIQVMQAHDSKHTLHYVDPPYVHSTRNTAKYAYQHELSDADHVELIEQLKNLKGKVVLSGYPNDIYDTRLKSWRRIERKAFADGARERTEVLWLNHDLPNSLFSEVSE